MTDHAQYSEALALYALGALDNPQEYLDLQVHLGACGECRRELEALRGDMALLALAATGPQPPQRARRRLLDAVAAEPRQKRRSKSPFVLGRLQRRWLTLAPMAVTLVLAVFSLLLLRDNLRMRRRYDRTVAELRDAQLRSAHAQEVLYMLNAPNAVHMTLVSKRNPPQPQVKTIYMTEKGHVLLLANNLAPLPEGKCYELWLVPAKGGAPMPAGTFRPDSGGGGMMMHAMETEGIEAKAFAITIEPAEGSKAPTSEILLAPAS